MADFIGQMVLTVRTFAPGYRGDDGEYHAGTRRVVTVEVVAAIDGEVYGVDLSAPSAVSVSATAAVSASTVGDIADDLAEAWNASAAATTATAASDGSGTVTLTETAPGTGMALALDEHAADMALLETVAAVAPYATTTLWGTWRPMPARQVQLLPMGDRERDPRVIHTETRVQLGSQHDNVSSSWMSADLGSTWYEVVDEFDGTALDVSGITHYRYSALRLQETG